MYLVTNRVVSNGNTVEVFGDKPSPEGPNELRIVEVNRKDKQWHVSAVKDKLSSTQIKKLAKEHHLNIDTTLPWHGSLEVACKLFEQAKQENKAILFFVHGYNNDVNDVLLAAEQLEDLYDLIVVPFTWPANGGGAITGTASYLSDKTDARASSGAFNRFVGKIQYFHTLLSKANLNSIKDKVELKYEGKENPMAAAALYSELVGKACKVKINLLCHSMGNYLLKHSLMTSDNATSDLVFDNINLVAADTNNKNHASWLDTIDVRNRIHIVINEDDLALKASRVKPGKEQKARLGHFLKALNSEHGVYIDVTDADGVGSEHSYYKGDAIAANASLRALFNDLFNGNSVEKRLKYTLADNYYRLVSNRN
ncbi:MAG: esterase/lipase superfamily enzyme [Alphaproteobacteria bacterium]|jgi:esterase/lipase superfamily enzyme